MQASKGNSSNKNTNRRFKNPITIQEMVQQNKKIYDEHDATQCTKPQPESC